MNKVFLFSLILFFATNVLAQNKPVIFRINGKPVFKSEVEEAYKRTNTVDEEKEAVSDFVDRYINFKLNVEEAKDRKFDADSTYQHELSVYRSMLAAPYLKDTVYEIEYIQRIYDRMCEDVEVNHILIPFEKDIVYPADTILAYQKAIDLRKKILSKGFSGVEHAAGIAETSVAIGSQYRNGYIGWVTPFMFPSKVENAIYTLPQKEISLPIRTSKGYHIIQVLGKRPAIGQADVEQVMFGFPHIPPTKQQIDSVRKIVEKEHKNIKGTADFDQLCMEFSFAHQTGNKGCHYGILGLDSNMPPSFINAALNLEKPGDISKPVLTDYGFHIIRLLRKISLPTIDKVASQLRSRIINSEKVQELSNIRRERLFNNFNVQINTKAYQSLVDIAAKISPRDTAFLSYIKNGEEILFDIEGKRAYDVDEFALYISRRHKDIKNKPDEIALLQIIDATPYTLTTDILKDYLDGFIFLLLSDYAQATLEERQPEFEKAMRKFSEDLLFYNIQNEFIWNRTKNDTEGLNTYFGNNKNKYSLNNPLYKGMIIYCKDEKILKKAENISKKFSNNDKFIDEIRKTINKDSINVKMELGSWEDGENPYIDNKIFAKEKPSPKKDFPYFFVRGKLIDKPEEYTDVKNQVEPDFQEQLEKEWNTYLWNKYKVEIDRDVLKTIK